MNIRLILFFFICSLPLLKAQQPTYHILGENHFKSIQIYDVIQDKDQNFLFATNEGLYLYNFYSYKKIQCPEAKSISVFNFVLDNDGNIFCNNLNNQIFKIEENTCKLFYELDKDEYHSDITLSITSKNELCIGAKKIILLNNNGKVIARYAFKNHHLGPFGKLNNNNLICHLRNCDSVITYNGSNFIKQKLNIKSGFIEENCVLKFFHINKKAFALDLYCKILYSFNESTFELKRLKENPLFHRSKSIRLYETGNEIWIAGTLPGIAMLNEKTIEAESSLIYQNYFISDVFKDREGNILLGTFDKGIIVIPDLNIPDVIHSFNNDPIVALHSDKDLGLLLGSSQGKLMAYKNNKLNIINTNGIRPIESIHGNKESDIILFDDGTIRIFNKKTNKIIDVIEASLKDAAVISKTIFFIGTNRGIYKCTYSKNHKISIEPIEDLNFRIFSLAYNPTEKCLYAATSNGLYCRDSLENIKKVLFNEHEVFSNSLFYGNGKIFCTEKKNHILLIEKGKIINSIPISTNITFERLNKIILHENTIIGKSADGLFQFNMNGELLKSIHSTFSFSSKRVLDYIFHNKQLWVSHAGGVQKIDLNYSNKTSLVPLRFDVIKVNDSIINFAEKNTFESNESKFEFTVCSPSLKNVEPYRYHYTLIGYDNEWNLNNTGTNNITYNALAPGKYKLLVKLEQLGSFSKPINYTFFIAKPLYLRWWFILAYVTFFLVLVYLIYRWQLKRLSKKSEQINELNASKLTAIQSQMNPHFIFNSLNSIQDLVLKGDVENSYSYLTTFSNLVRRTLNYSEKDFIDFEQEIKLLELYLSLEKLRFKKDLNYTLKNFGIQDIMIPPLLIQPFVENSLVHGLLHKEGKKDLIITFELKDVLLCTIEDNGIGREKAKEIKQRQRSEHASFSGKAIHKRFEILSKLFDGKFGYEYKNIEENGLVKGTIVTLRIPIKHKY